MACSSCGKKGGAKAASQAAKGTPVAQNTSAARRDARSAPAANGDGGMVMVQENSGNRGNHNIVGARTRRKYGRHSHGDQFPMLAVDAQAQPKLYIIIDMPKPNEAQADVPMIPKPVAPVAQPAPIPAVAAQVEAKPADEPAPVVEEDLELDMALLNVTQIKNLDLDYETAQAAIEAEKAGKNRSSVISYLRNIKK